MRYSKEFKEKAVKTVLGKEENQSMGELSKKLKVSKATLYKWVREFQLIDSAFTIEEKLQMLNETYSMSVEETNGYCRERGIFQHQLKEFEDDFLHPKKVKIVEDNNSKKALQEEKERTRVLSKELRRKEKALAETAALLVLQKKFQALLEDEEL